MMFGVYCRHQSYGGSGKKKELISDILLILVQDRPYLELIIVSDNFLVLLFLQDKLLEWI